MRVSSISTSYCSFGSFQLSAITLSRIPATAHISSPDASLPVYIILGVSKLLFSVTRLSIEYGSEVFKGNKSQAGSLESIILIGAKWILGYSSKTCKEAVRGDLGLDTLQRRRDRAKLKL